MRDPHSRRPQSKNVTRDDIRATLPHAVNFLFLPPRVVTDPVWDGVAADIFDALPVVEPAASAETDAAWEALRDDIAGVAYELTRRPNGPSELRGELSGIIDRHCSIIEAALTAAGDAEREVERELAYSHGYGDAIRSAGTPPATRDVDDRLVRSLTKWLQQSGWVRRHELARAESEAFANTFANAFPFAATPPEPVGGREREAIADTLMDLRMSGPWSKADGMTYQEAMRHYADVIVALPELRLRALQASPPTGVSDDQCPERCLGIVDHPGPHQTSDYEPDTLGVVWAAAEAALPEGWSGPVLRRSYDFPGQYWALMSEDDGDHFREGYGETPAAALRALTVALAREQADSEPGR